MPELRKKGHTPNGHAVYSDQMPELWRFYDKSAIGVSRRSEVQLVIYPNPILQAHSAPVSHVGNKERSLFKRMLINMRRWNGVGLAAPQVGYLLRMIVAEVGGTTLAMANPTILECKGMSRMIEGCLSLPNKEVDVMRSTSIWIKADNEENKQVELKQEGLLARILQHEIDHLDGVLIIDHGPVITRESSDKQNVIE